MTRASTAKSESAGPFEVLILAAGLGSRMRSKMAKVLHKLSGRPLISHVCRTAAALEPDQIIVVVGYQASEVEAAVRDELQPQDVAFVIQREQRGTGHAVMAAREALQGRSSTIMVLSGDVPLISPETLATMLQQHGRTGAACTMLTVKLEDPSDYGRVLRDSNGHFHRIVEQKDATPLERQIKEINAGIYCFETKQLFSALEQVKPLNIQGEYYLTDVPGILTASGEVVSVYLHPDPREVCGINTRVELAEIERLLRRRTVLKMMLDWGVTIVDPDHTYIGPDVRIGRDTVIQPDVHLEGSTVIGESCEIRSGSRISNSTIGNNVTIKDHCVILDSNIADNCAAGPFAHLRMNAQMEESSLVGNFVEVKKSRLGRKSKSMHLTYLGDATIGQNTNIGAGTVTCNYDGKQKHQTIIEDDVKIGSDTMLVAPVRVGKGSVTGAGSVVTKDVPPHTLVAGVPATKKKSLENGSQVDSEKQKPLPTEEPAGMAETPR